MNTIQSILDLIPKIFLSLLLVFVGVALLGGIFSIIQDLFSKGHGHNTSERMNEIERSNKQLKELVNEKSQEIESLKAEIEQGLKNFDAEKEQADCRIRELCDTYEQEIACLKRRLDNSESIHIQENDFKDILNRYDIDLNKLKNYDKISTQVDWDSQKSNDEFRLMMYKRIDDAICDQFKFRYLLYLYPELATHFKGNEVLEIDKQNVSKGNEDLFYVVRVLEQSKESVELLYLKRKQNLYDNSASNLMAIPYMASIMADYEVAGMKAAEASLDWGNNQKRREQRVSIRAMRRIAEMAAKKNYEAKYQLNYLLSMFPQLEEVVDSNYNELPGIEDISQIEHDEVRDYLSKEEYSSLNSTERNQLALDRYKESHRKTKWQIGRDYELYIGFKYASKGYQIDYYGSYMGKEDLGRDLIATKDNRILIIQCKYWGTGKRIHENHINQLYGTMMAFCIEHNVPKNQVEGVLITNIELSDMAKKMANYLGIIYKENYPIGDYPCIKCNINYQNGVATKIYHLPFDQQYDNTKVTDKGEFFALTVAEAESAGFRRARKWLGN